MTKNATTNQGEGLLPGIENGMGLQPMLDAAAAILGNPLVMIDITYNLLAHTENRVMDDPLWNELLSLGRFSHKTVHFFNVERFIEAYAKSDTVSLLKSSKLQYDRVNGILYNSDGIQIGNICVVACYRPLEEGDYARIAQICEYLGRELQNSPLYAKIERAFEPDPLDELIEGREMDSDKMEALLDELYAGLKDNLYVAVIEVAQYEKTLTHLAYFRRQFRELQPYAKCFIYLNNLVMVISTDKIYLDEKKDLAALRAFFIEYFIDAGISASFQNLRELNKHYRQALTALNYGLNSGLDINIFKYDDFRLDYLLQSLGGQLDIRELCNPVVFQLQQYDENNDTDFFNMVYVFLLNEKNVTEAARKLGLSEKELQGRLEKAISLFGLDWSNGLKCGSLLLSLRILKCLC